MANRDKLNETLDSILNPMDSCILDWELYQKVMAKKNKNTIKICTGVGLNMFFPEYITVEIEKPIEKEYKNKKDGKI
jgi:hypothetical protein